MTATATATTDGLYPRELLLQTLIAIKKGGFSVRMPIDQTGVAGKIADTLNEIIDLKQRLVREQERVSVMVGNEGKVARRIAGWWMCDSISGYP